MSWQKQYMTNAFRKEHVFGLSHRNVPGSSWIKVRFIVPVPVCGKSEKTQNIYIVSFRQWVDLHVFMPLRGRVRPHRGYKYRHPTNTNAHCVGGVVVVAGQILYVKKSVFIGMFAPLEEKNQSFTMFLKHQGRKLFKHRYMIFCQNFSERNIIFHHFRKNFSWGWDYSLHTQSPTQENPLISCTFCSTLIYKITIRLWLHVCWCPPPPRNLWMVLALS